MEDSSCTEKNESFELKWICLSTSVFDNPKIKLIMAMPQGDALFNCWLRLYCLAGKCNSDGQIFISPQVPVNPEVLAQIFGKPLDLIQTALEIFERLGMINREESGALCIIDWEKDQHQNGIARVREKSRQRTARCRARQNKASGSADLSAGNQDDSSVAKSDECSSELIERFGPAFEKLSATKQIPALKIEHLVFIDREYPKARLAENIDEVVTEARAEAGIIRNALKWLRPVAIGLAEREGQRNQRSLNKIFVGYHNDLTA